MNYFVIGMAGSGKSTLVRTLQQRLSNPFIINLDPAIQTLAYVPDVDIRDSVDYDQLTSTSKLGPNGAILTALNLFVTKLDQLAGVIPSSRPIVFDSPGQIESFIWSASGEILLKSFPGAVLYVTDAKKAVNPSIFVSSMLYLLGVQQRLNITEIIVVMNKSDLLSDLTDEFKQILSENEETGESELDLVQLYSKNSLVLTDSFKFQAENDYQGSFLSNVTLYLDKFWQKNKYCFVSCKKGTGIDLLINEMERVQKNTAVEEKDKDEKYAEEKKEKQAKEKEKFEQEFNDHRNMDEND
ncbi:ATP-binding_protein [Hexamita inflata]|uniref:GPN-loop GTPase n=1 Tax=Hexamita inflata TaxID=28002 RepID=A0AA86N778_9EUKA|nr:ATP-binding protein [Hexamita inflata]